MSTLMVGLRKLKLVFRSIIKVNKIFRFSNKIWKQMPQKFNFFLTPYQQTLMNINGSGIKSSNCEKLLRVNIANDFTFEKHFKKLVKNCICYLEFCSKKNWILFKTFITLQFNDCPLVWMFHSRGLNNKLNNIHTRALRKVFQDKESILQDLLQKNNFVSLHMKNLQYLVT